MSMYMAQFSYTAEAWRALAKNPADRRVGLRALIEKMGGRLLDLHYCFGEFDGLFIFEAPDEKTSAAIILAALSPGHVSKVQTTVLLSVEETMAAMAQAGNASYSAPKA